jgi:phage terminase large subunit-like protein
MRRAKGWGKSPFVAVIALVEFLGPCRFWKFHNGIALGKSVSAATIHLAAVSVDQTDNTMSAIRGALVGSPLADGLDINKTVVQHKDNRPGKICPITSNPRSQEGPRPTFAVIDESHHLNHSNGGRKLASVVDRNIRKRSGRYIETTNAFSPNEDSVAQATYESYLDGNPSLLYDCAEGTVFPVDFNIKSRDNTEAIRDALREAYGDAYWVDFDSLLEGIFGPNCTEAEAYRFYLNQIRESADDWMSKQEWKDILSAGTPAPSTDKRKKVQIAIGFDGSLYHDSTAIVGCEMATGKLFVLGLWEKPDNAEDWAVPVFEVEARMKWVVENYEVVWAYCDESYWQNVVARWALEYKWGRDEKDCFFAFSPQRARQMAEAVARFRVAVSTRDSICHDGNEALERHVLNAHRKETPHGDLITKEHKNSKKKIDAAICAVLAYQARADALADNRMKAKRGAKMRSY